MNSLYYDAIKAHYGDRRAVRSGVPLINHIDEGLRVLRAIGASDEAMDAFCLHPLLQADEDLAKLMQSHLINSLEPYVVVLAMEYRRWANAYLSDKVGYSHAGWYWTTGAPRTGPLPAVRDMLIADKVQNRKDFELHHFGIHPETAKLDFYFRSWLEALGVTEARYDELVEVMES